MTGFRRFLMVSPMLALIGAAPLDTTDNPKVLKDLFQCRSVSGDAERLACFDKASSQLAAATDQGDVRMVDKEQVTRTRRALFGFALPSIDLFASSKGAPGEGRKGNADEIKQIDAKITGVGTNRDGGYVFTLDDGSRWEQTDNVGLGRTPRSGNAVNITRGALGSYKLEVERGPAMKVRRVA